MAYIATGLFGSGGIPRAGGFQEKARCGTE